MLSRDIRSVTQRIKVPKRAQQGGPAALSGGGSGGGSGGLHRGSSPGEQQQQRPEDQQSGEEQQQQQQGEGYWKVVLDGVEVSYDEQGGSQDVWLRSARVVAAG